MSEERFKRNPKNIITAFFGFLGFLLYAAICSFAGYKLAALIFNITGEPPLIVTYIVSSVLSLVVLGAVANLMVRIRMRNKDWPHDEMKHDGMQNSGGRNGGRRNGRRYNRMMADTFQAINQIAQGDFSVFIESNERDPHHELAMRVNQMAKELSSMETLRQDFVSNISHEIQSPLTSISGYATLLERDDLTKEQREHYLHIIKKESNRLSKLSKNLLKLSSLEAGAIPLSNQRFRLDNQLQKVTVLLEPQWSKKDIIVEAELNNITVLGDEELLSQVWINLLNNAIKFTPEGGRIQITLTADEKSACCTIMDNGIGISSKDQIHIFERFYKVDKSRDRTLGGNGLGLSLVKKIVELHNGTVSVKSEVGKGTAFTISLPLTNASQA